MKQKIRSLSLSTALALGLFAPSSALAYLSPEQVFGGSSLTLQPAPPTQREGSDVVAARQQEAAARRAEEQKNMRPEGTPPDLVPLPHEPSPRNLLNEDTQYNLRMQRKQQGSSGTPVIVIGPPGEVLDSSGNVLKSGAPLVTSTGPETILALTLMILATLSTFAFVHVRGRAITVAI